MYYEIVLAFLGASILLYCLLGGADFGAGILEIFRGRSYREEQQQAITDAMGPVWEANHMWLILAVVILFVGFPAAYVATSIYLHIPITALLIGIILRGCAFAFRHYDVERDASQKAYSFVFGAASALTPFFMGVLAGAMVLGRIDPDYNSYYSGYIAPWYNLFSASLGLFTCSLFAFLAAIYLIDEAKDDAVRALFTQRARAANIACVITGGLVFASAQHDELPLLGRFLADPLANAALILATLLLLPLWSSLRSGHSTRARFYAATQGLLILTAFFYTQYPVVMATRGEPLTFVDAKAPDAALRPLAYALMGGTLFILPCLAYLLYIFKSANGRA